MPTPRPLSDTAWSALVTIAHGYAHSAEQVAGTISASARTGYYANSGRHTRLNGNTVNALARRGLVTSVDVRTRGAYQYATLTLTDAGWQSLADAYGVEARPEQDTPTSDATVPADHDHDSPRPAVQPMDDSPRAYADGDPWDTITGPWWAQDEVMGGRHPLTGEWLAVIDVARPSGRDGGLALWQHPADDDGGWPFWQRCPTVRLG